MTQKTEPTAADLRGLHLPFPVDILFAVVRKRGWKITVEEEGWDLTPNRIAVASCAYRNISVNGSQPPDMQAAAVTEIVYSYSNTPFGYPDICEDDIKALWNCKCALIRYYWQDIQDVLAAVAPWLLDGAEEAHNEA